MTTLTLMHPTVHLNGTSRQELTAQLEAAYAAIDAALNALAAAAPHGRDYYPQGPDAYSRARAEHDARMDRLRRVRAELAVLADRLVNHQQGGGR